MNVFATAIRPLRHYADFSGRSGRSELLLFCVLFALLGVVAGLAKQANFQAGERLSLALSLTMLCPFAALGVRRLHDTGRNGLWLLLTVPALALAAWARFQSFGSPVPLRATDLFPPIIELPATLCALPLILLLLWKDDEETNRYGPNPRYGEREAAA